jgi:hypothetical protein
MMKYTFAVILISGCIFSACNNTPETPTEKPQQPSQQKADFKGKVTSLIDVNVADNFEDQGYGAIDSLLVKKLFENVFNGNLKAVKDMGEKNSMSKQEIIAELKNAAHKSGAGSYRKNFFLDVDGEKIPMREIIHLLTKDEISLQEPGFNLTRKTQEIAIVAQTYDEKGNERGKKILFWIILNQQKES